MKTPLARTPLARATLAGACVLTLALPLGGCLSMLQGKPSNLYRFGQPAAGEAAPAAPAGQVGVLKANGSFQREAAGDRILTVNGGEVAYLAKTRWAAPAAALFDQAVLAAFDADGGPARIISRGEPASAAYILRLDVRNFEARYEAGPKAAPTVLVRVRAAMTRGGDQAVVADQLFEARAPAGGNRVTAVVAAFDTAVADVLKQIVAWTNARARPS